MVLLADRPDHAELQYRLSTGFGRRHTGAQILRRLQREMFFHLFPQPLVVAPSRGEIRQPRQKPFQKPHDKSPAFASKKRAMMAAVCSQSRVSVCNCLWPAFVRR